MNGEGLANSYTYTTPTPAPISTTRSSRGCVSLIHSKTKYATHDRARLGSLGFGATR